MAELRFDESANLIYQFTWASFCDWYLELIKPVSIGDERGQIDEETREVAGWVLDQILVMLHPVHALHHGRALACDGRAALSADRRQMADAGRAAPSIRRLGRRSTG
jgi:hypothetical protein